MKAKLQRFSDPYGWNKEKIERYQNSGHKWEETEDGTVDIFAVDNDMCNGPRCTVCGYGTCWNCTQNPPICKK